MTFADAIRNMQQPVVFREGSASEDRGVLVACTTQWAYVDFGLGGRVQTAFRAIEFTLPPLTVFEEAELAAHRIEMSS